MSPASNILLGQSITPEDLLSLLCDDFFNVSVMDLSNQEYGYICGAYHTHPFSPARRQIEVTRGYYNDSNDNHTSDGYSSGDDARLNDDLESQPNTSHNNQNDVDMESQSNTNALEEMFDQIDLDFVSTNDSNFRRRKFCTVVIYDEFGKEGGWAHQASNIVANDKNDNTYPVYWLKGGIKLFSSLYPALTSVSATYGILDEMEWVKTNDKFANIYDNNDGSSNDEEFELAKQVNQVGDGTCGENNLNNPEYAKLGDQDMLADEEIDEDFASVDSDSTAVAHPIHTLRQKQKHLINAVWYGKRIPIGDIPICIVPPFLYLGSCQTASREFIKKYQIHHVIRLGWGFSDMCGGDEVVYHDYPIEDSPRTPIHVLLDGATEIIERARINGQKVLVHCYAGVSRSSTIILAYLMKYMRLRLIDAWNLTYKLRPIIRPNHGFASALQAYEKVEFKVENSSLPLFWMSESFIYYMEYLDFEHRLSQLPQSEAKETSVEEEVCLDSEEVSS